MRIKIPCVVLAVLLVAQFTGLYGSDQRTVARNGDAPSSYSFAVHMALHDYRNYGIHAYRPYHAATGSTQSLAPPGITTYQTTSSVSPYKDPFIAGVLSWFMMGVGQIYAGEYWKGSLFIAASLTNKILLVLLLNHINSKYGSSDQIVNVNWSTFDTSTRVLIVLYIVEALGLRIFNVVDAVRSAQRYNERIEATRESGLSFDIGEDDVSLYYYYRFNE
jgi:TM2 domain-containing membrane protein YozV